MPSSGDTLDALTASIDRAHGRPARVLAELLIAGNRLFASGCSDNEIGDAFEEFVADCLTRHGVSQEEFSKVVDAMASIQRAIEALAHGRVAA